MRQGFRPVEPSVEMTCELQPLIGYRIDLIADRVRLINRLRDVLVGICPALEAAFDYSKRPELSDMVVRELESGHRHLLLDLTGITYCDSGSLYTLLGMRHAASHVGGSLALTAASKCVCEALDCSGLRDQLPFSR